MRNRKLRNIRPSGDFSPEMTSTPIGLPLEVAGVLGLGHGCRSLPLSEWTANIVYTRLWSLDRQIEPPCRLQLGSILGGCLLVVTRYVAA